MSSSLELPARIGSVLSAADALFFDFDGPICALFSNYSPKITAAEARLEFSRQEISLPQELHDTPGGLALVQWAAENTPSVAPEIERIQEAGELRAVSSARPTAHGTSAIATAARIGFKLAIVSNNAPSAIDTYIHARGLDKYIMEVSARVRGDFKSMKPHPDPLFRAAVSLDVPIGRCVMIGDSATDIEAANRAGALSIGYALTSSAVTALTAAGAKAVIYSMAELTSALQNIPQTA